MKHQRCFESHTPVEKPAHVQPRTSLNRLLQNPTNQYMLVSSTGTDLKSNMYLLHLTHFEFDRPVHKMNQCYLWLFASN